MKSLPITSHAFKYVEQSFKEWLEVLGYESQGVYYLPINIRAYLHYLESIGKINLNDITKESIKTYYYTVLKNRTNQRLGAGGLSNAYLNKHIQAFQLFAQYLRQSGRLMLGDLNLRHEKQDKDTATVLTQEEIKQLYNACDRLPEFHGSKPDWFYQAMSYRDKAMLTVYYGCGLRRNEGIQLNLSDIHWEKQLLHVRKGKNNKERLVPISKSGIMHLQNYRYDARPYFIRKPHEEAFFVSERGSRIQGQSLYLRLMRLVEISNNSELRSKEIGLHTLRHSIATHLLRNGMKLEKIKEFLGHSSLESTQIYTHLLEVEQNG